MSSTTIALQLTEALETLAAREGAGGLVSVTIERLAAGDGETTVRVARKTRTLLFLSAELRDGANLIATASSIHKVSK